MYPSYKLVQMIHQILQHHHQKQCEFCFHFHHIWADFPLQELQLVNEFDEAKKLLSEMSEEKQQEFSDYPVYRFYKESMY